MLLRSSTHIVPLLRFRRSLLAGFGCACLQVKVAMIGAGAVNFGSCEGPWNHSARLQQLQHVVFSAVIDPDLSLARQRVATLAQG